MAYIGVSPSNGVRQKHTYTATASQTTFSGAGAEGISLSYRDSNYVDVYRNGVKLGDADYTATSGTSIVLGEGAAVNDIVEIVVYDVFSVADTVSKADGGTFDGNVAMAGTLAVTGETTLSANLNLGDNDRAIFGAGDDLQIYHDTSVNHSYISESGSGDLIIEGGNIRLENGSSQYYIRTYNNAQVELFYNNSEKLATTNTGIDVTGVITTDGMTTSADINFGDNDKAIFGAGSDLQIYHDGSNSYISDQGDGNLLIQAATNTQIKSADGTLLSAKFRPDLAADLYYNNQLKFSTTNTGIDVTGTATMDGLTVDGDININGFAPSVIMTDSSASPGAHKLLVDNGDFHIQYDAGEDGTFEKTFFKVEDTGDISFYEDTGTTPKLFWDASAERLGIGTSSPSSPLHVIGGGAGSLIIDGTDSIRTSTDDSLITISGGNSTNSGANYSLFGNTHATLASTHRWRTNGSERMRIDSSGNVGIGTSSPASRLTMKTSGNGYTDGFIIEDADSTTRSGITHVNGGLYISSNASTDHVIIDSSGNVGIGITPTNTFHVGASGTVTSRYTSTDTGAFSLLRFENTGSIVLSADHGNTQSNSNIVFQRDGATESMRITSDGNVGIGTTSPQDIIDIRGGASSSFIFGTGANAADSTLTLEFRDRYGTSGFGQGQIASFIKNVRDGSSGDYDLIFGTNTGTTTNASERMRIDSNGNVGINETSPDAKLHITTNDNSTLIKLESTDADAIVGPRMDFVRNSSSPADNDETGVIRFRGENSASEELSYVEIVSQIKDVTDGTEDGNINFRVMVDGTLRELFTATRDSVVVNQDSIDIDFRVESDNNTHALFVQGSDGNVGIGTSSPSTNLDFGLTSNNSWVVTTRKNGNSVNAIGINSDYGMRFGSPSDVASALLSFGSILTSDGSTFSEKMRIDSSGNFLVGTTDNSPYNNTSGTGFVVDSGGYFSVTREGVVGYFNRNTSDGDVVHFRKDGTTVGSIGVNSIYMFIGTPSYSILKFDNAKIIPADNDGNSRDNAIDLGVSSSRFDDIFATNGTIQTSDQQEKNTITDSDLGLDFIKRLSPKSYIFNGKTRTHYGLIAQDVETVLTDIGKTGTDFAGFIKSDISEEQDGSSYRYGLRYTEFVAPLIQAVKDQQATIDAQQTTITALEARIVALENAE